jgi:hypothetical protein
MYHPFNFLAPHSTSRTKLPCTVPICPRFMNLQSMFFSTNLPQQNFLTQRRRGCHLYSAHSWYDVSKPHKPSCYFRFRQSRPEIRGRPGMLINNSAPFQTSLNFSDSDSTRKTLWRRAPKLRIIFGHLNLLAPYFPLSQWRLCALYRLALGQLPACTPP